MIIYCDCGYPIREKLKKWNIEHGDSKVIYEFLDRSRIEHKDIGNCSYSETYYCPNCKKEAGFHRFTDSY